MSKSREIFLGAPWPVAIQSFSRIQRSKLSGEGNFSFPLLPSCSSEMLGNPAGEWQEEDERVGIAGKLGVQPFPLESTARQVFHSFFHKTGDPSGWLGCSLSGPWGSVDPLSRTVLSPSSLHSLQEPHSLQKPTKPWVWSQTQFPMNLNSFSTV